MTKSAESRGELVELLLKAIAILPEEEWVDAASYAAFALGGRSLEFVPAPDRIPQAGTVGAEEFIAGRTMERGRYLQLLRSRLLEVIDDGLREDFVVRAVAQEISRQFSELTDTEAINASRARLKAGIERQIADPDKFRAEMESLDPSVLDLSDKEFVEHLRSLLDRVSPVSKKELAAHYDLRMHWEASRQEHLSDDALDDWFGSR